MDCLLGEERKNFDPVTCQCVDSYFLQYKEMTFAATGYECLGRNNFFITNTNTAQYPPPLPSLAMEQYSMDTSPFTYNAWYGLERKTPRELIYQCVFTRNVRIKVTTCDVADQECLKDLCAKYLKIRYLSGSLTMVRLISLIMPPKCMRHALKEFMAKTGTATIVITLSKAPVCLAAVEKRVVPA